MERYFGDVCNKKVIIGKADILKLKKYNKTKHEHYFEVVSNDQCYIAEIKSEKPFNADVVRRINTLPETNAYILVAFSPLKYFPSQYLLKWFAELGVSEIRFLKSDKDERIKKSELSHKEIDKLHHFLADASLSAKRVRVPYLGETLNSDQFFKLNGDYKLLINNTFKAKKRSIKNCLKDNKIKSPRIVIGISNESGFSDRELSLASQNNFEEVNVSKRHLSSELLCLYGLRQLLKQVEKIK